MCERGGTCLRKGVREGGERRVPRTLRSRGESLVLREVNTHPFARNQGWQWKPTMRRHAQATDNKACTSHWQWGVHKPAFLPLCWSSSSFKKNPPVSKRRERRGGGKERERDLGEWGREWCCKMCRDATKASLNSNATPNRRKWKRFGYWKICRERGGREGHFNAH